MLELDKKYSDKQKVFDELLFGSGVVVFRNIFDLKKIEEARNITNHFAENQEQKETHFNAEAESSGKIHLQQRVWNLFGKGEVFSDLITNDLIFDLMGKFLGSEQMSQIEQFSQEYIDKNTPEKEMLFKSFLDSQQGL